MSLRFGKMHGLGNDFMVIDALSQSVSLDPQTIRQWADRHTGIGFDQCLVVEAAHAPGVDFNYRIFNANGQEVGQCGNGARCLALFIHLMGLSTKTEWQVATATTVMKLALAADNQVSVWMPAPRFLPAEIPLRAAALAETYPLLLPDGQTQSVYAVNVGNPHAISLVADVDTAPVRELGHLISHHPDFPEQTNAGFMQQLSTDALRLRVYERGCGETQACGSGAVAAAVVGRRYLGMSTSIQVSLPGGDLRIEWPGEDQDIVMTGPAVLVYWGELVQ